jgi:chemotaxis protein MotB
VSEKEGDKGIPPPKKKKHHDHGGSHGAWKVAFADFMTSMFALFLVLWIISSTSASQKEAIAQYFQNPSIFRAGSSSPMDMGGTIKEKAKKGEGHAGGSKDKEAEKMRALDSLLQSDSALKELGKQFKTRMTDKGLEIELSDAQGLGSFELGSARLNPRMMEPLKRMAKAFEGLPNKMVIAGHTDKYGYSGGGYSNWQLSSDRANAVRDEFTASGLPSERFNSVIGYGDNEPAKPDDPYAAENRRVTILILKQGASMIPQTRTKEDEEKEAKKDRWRPLGETVERKPEH